MPLWKCRNELCNEQPGSAIGFRFEAAAPVCPKCNTDARLPKFKGAIVRIHTIHYDPPSGFRGVGTGKTLCKGETVERLYNKRPYEQATADPEIVNCAACKAHPDFPAEDTWHDVQAAGVPDWRVGEKSGGRIDIRELPTPGGP